ncbi:MAG: methyltransferase domain-containing protein [Bacteroidota bacterium]
MALSNIESVIAFYDAVADDYNSHMTMADKNTRNLVRDIFKQHVSGGTVLDFGGGTGLDLPWLLEQYNIIFLEPSLGMRAVARKNITAGKDKLKFVEHPLIISEWSLENLPFPEKVNGVIANFAVLNCIGNIEEFFKKVALVCQRNANVVVTVLDASPLKIWRQYSLRAVLRLLLFGKITVHHQHKGKFHETHVYSAAAIRKSSGSFFSLKSQVLLPQSDFAVFVFSKK